MLSFLEYHLAFVQAVVGHRFPNNILRLTSECVCEENCEEIRYLAESLRSDESAAAESGCTADEDEVERVGPRGLGGIRVLICYLWKGLSKTYEKL